MWVFGKVTFIRNDEAENLLFKVMVQEQELSFPSTRSCFGVKWKNRFTLVVC